MLLVLLCVAVLTVDAGAYAIVVEIAAAVQAVDTFVVCAVVLLLLLNCSCLLFLPKLLFLVLGLILGLFCCSCVVAVLQMFQLQKAARAATVVAYVATDVGVVDAVLLLTTTRATTTTAAATTTTTLQVYACCSTTTTLQLYGCCSCCCYSCWYWRCCLSRFLQLA